MKHYMMTVLALLIVMLCCVQAAADYRIQVSAEELNPMEGLDEQWLNILLIGTDSRTDVQNAGRSDTMMICSYHLETGELKLTSLARDMWVEISGAGSNRLNAAHSFGGPNLLMKTVNETFSMNIVSYISVNFFGLAEIVEALGGVDIELESGEAGVINQSVTADFGSKDISPLPGGSVGVTHLNGWQALEYARIRKLDNDFGRTSRQRKLLAAILSQLRQLSLARQIGFAQACMEHISTNIPAADLATMAVSALSHGISSLEELSIPQTGSYRYESADGISKIIFDREACTAEIYRFIYGET